MTKIEASLRFTRFLPAAAAIGFMTILPCFAKEPLDSSLPDRIMVGTDPVRGGEFTLWKADASAYAGKYSGDISGDTAASLEVLVSQGTDDAPHITLSGTYREEPAGLAPIVVTFRDAIFHEDTPTVLDAGAFRVNFVRRGETYGVVIAGAFIPKEPAGNTP